MEGKSLIRSLRLLGFLSYGGRSQEVELGPLNVLIGPNCSGKSNFIAALRLLKWAPRDLNVPIREGGGVTEWLWKGPLGQREDDRRPPSFAMIEAVVAFPDGPRPLRHAISFTATGQRLDVLKEVIQNAGRLRGDNGPVCFLCSQRGAHNAELSARTDLSAQAGTGVGREERPYPLEKLPTDQSVLSQFRDPAQYPEISYLGRAYDSIRVYENLATGRGAPVRTPQRTDQAGDFLAEDGSNLGMVLSDLDAQPGMSAGISEKLGAFYPRAERVVPRVHGATIQVLLLERGTHQPIPATRLSDGFLRYLRLLTVLCHPSPPPLICIEEPELGLHPDVVGTVAELLVEASRRTQLIVTTHSDLLVSALSDVPEAVLVCERDEDGTHLRRLEKDKLKEWLDEYTLGDLWLRGKIGGTTT